MTVVNPLMKKIHLHYVKTELLTHIEYIDHRLRDDPGLGGRGCRLVLRCADAITPLGNYSASTGRNDSLFYWHTQTENIEHFDLRIVSKSTVLLLSVWGVVSLSLPRNLEHAHLSLS